MSSIVNIRITQLEHTSGVTWVIVGQHCSVANTIQVLRTNQPPVSIVIVRVVPIVSVMMASKVVTHLVQGGVVTIGTALLDRGQCVAVSRGHSVSVSAATVLKIICQKLGSISGTSLDQFNEFTYFQGTNLISA